MKKVKIVDFRRNFSVLSRYNRTLIIFTEIECKSYLYLLILNRRPCILLKNDVSRMSEQMKHLPHESSHKSWLFELFIFIDLVICCYILCFYKHTKNIVICSTILSFKRKIFGYFNKYITKNIKRHILVLETKHYNFLLLYQHNRELLQKQHIP